LPLANLRSRLSFLFSSRRRHTRCYRDWSSDVCSSDLPVLPRVSTRSGGFVREHVAPKSHRRLRRGIHLRNGPDGRNPLAQHGRGDRKSTRLNSSHGSISYAVFCLKKKKRRRYVYNDAW